MENKIATGLHPSHETRVSMGASSYDEICIYCGRTDIVIGGLAKLAEPCPNFAKRQEAEKKEKDLLNSFGIKKRMSTYEYVMWLESEKGNKFLKSITPNDPETGYQLVEEFSKKIGSSFHKIV